MLIFCAENSSIIDLNKPNDPLIMMFAFKMKFLQARPLKLVCELDINFLNAVTGIEVMLTFAKSIIVRIVSDLPGMHILSIWYVIRKLTAGTNESNCSAVKFLMIDTFTIQIGLKNLSRLWKYRNPLSHIYKASQLGQMEGQVSIVQVLCYIMAS